MDTKYLDGNINKDAVVGTLVDRTLQAWKALVAALTLLRVDPDNHEATFLVTQPLSLLLLGVELIGIPQLFLILPQSHHVAFAGCVTAFLNTKQDDGGITYDNLRRRLLTEVRDLPAMETCSQEMEDAVARYMGDVGDMFLLQRTALGMEC